MVETAGSELAEAGRRVAVAVQLGSVPATRVDAGTARGDVVVDLRGEFVIALVAPTFSGGATFSGGLGEGSPQVGLDLCLPGVLIDGVRLLRGLGVDRLTQKGIESKAIGAAFGVDGSRESRGARVELGLHVPQSELLKTQHLLGETHGPIEGAGRAARGNIETAGMAVVPGLGVVRRGISHGAGHTTFKGALVHVGRAHMGVRAHD